MARSPLMMAEIRLTGTSMSRDSLFCDTPSGLRNSSSRISPGGIGSKVSGNLSPVVVDDLDIFRITVLPVEAYAPLVIDPDAPLTFPVALERLQTISRG